MNVRELIIALMRKGDGEPEGRQSKVLVVVDDVRFEVRGVEYSMKHEALLVHTRATPQ